jgi:hypothetical protein
LQVLQENQKNITRLLENHELLEHHVSTGKKSGGFTDYLKEHKALGEEFHSTMLLKDFCTIKSEVIGDVDASSHEGSLTEPKDDFLEVHVSTLVEYVCNEVEKISAFNTPLEISEEVDNINAYYGNVDCTYDYYDYYDELCVELSLEHSSSSTTETCVW